jgi:hypothetical protein
MGVAAVDAHVHVFRDEEQGLLAQGGSRLAGYAGVVDEIRGVLDASSIDRALVYGALPVELWRRLLGPGWPAAEVEDRLTARAIGDNEWLCQAATADDRLLAVIGADATLASGPHLEHLRQLLGRHHVAAIKIHPALNYVFPDDPGYRPVYELAVEAGLPVVSHGGGSAEGLYPSDTDYCAAEHFAPVLAAHPELCLVVAHLAHPYVDDLVDLAATYPNLHTDLSFVLGAELVSAEALPGVIRGFGVERVLFGTDFPYFDPAISLERLEALDLSKAETELVAAGNAARLFGLD